MINDVIGSVRESFLDESVDENVLMELRNLWQQKLDASKAVDTQVLIYSYLHFKCQTDVFIIYIAL